MRGALTLEAPVIEIEAGAMLLAFANAGGFASGDILLDAGEEPGLYFAEIDPSRTADVRRRIPVLQHRRDIAAP